MIRREKVKDIVEVRTFTHLNDFTADPGLTIASYHFTDVTSDLMGNWIDAISHVKPGRGEAFALAGLRGVGKSHFLAVLSALASRPELRTNVRDPHILSCLEGIPKRSLSIAFVKRGTGSTLVSELRSAIEETLSIGGDELSDSLTDLLIKASERAKDNFLLIFIDTALGREARVDRDDGPLLSEIAEVARNIGIFVGIALDDDVSGADGPNSSIAKAYQIHFLDQEHLYRIVDRHIFPKNDAMLPILRDIYSGYQSKISGFKWSEQRFVPLYPMHPATLEISPLIRLFIQDFALLGFASEAAVKIMGRPADSLIGLDEMFSSVEPKLRKDPQLESAFRVFDQLDQQVVQKSEVQFRLKAKLILKGLFLLSLDGQGASAATIAASMMVFDDQDPSSGLDQVTELLDKFATGFPQDVTITRDAGKSPHYCLRIGVNEDLDKAIEALGGEVRVDEIWVGLIQHLGETFPEIQNDGLTDVTSQVVVEWRGSMRRGKIYWHLTDEEEVRAAPGSVDWELRLLHSDDIAYLKNSSTDCSLDWIAAELTPEESDTVKAAVILKRNKELRQRYGDAALTKAHLVSASLTKICQRVFFEDAALRLGDRKFDLRYDLNSSHNLSRVFSMALMPVFEYLYPKHPYFLHPLGPKEVSQLTADFFGRADISKPNVQNLAQLLAEPLGLAKNGPDGYYPSTADVLEKLDTVTHAFGDWDGMGNLGLAHLAARFKSCPYGLTHEAQQLILAAMVAQRSIEFVTAHGNRINFRSLDLQIIWDDVTGVSRPTEEKYSDAKLLSWFRTLTGDQSVQTIVDDQAALAISRSLQKWQADWLSGKILANYEVLPDEGLNASSWRTASSVKKSLGAVDEIIQSCISNSISARESLVSIADLFLGSESEFIRRKSDLTILDEFTRHSRSLQQISFFVSESELTDDLQVERARQVLLRLMERSSLTGTAANQSLRSAWETFHGKYKEFYLRHHHDLFASDRSAELRKLARSSQWQRFEQNSRLSGFDRKLRERIYNSYYRYRDTNCQFDAGRCLDSRPYCFCGLTIADIRLISETPNEITSVIDRVFSSPGQGIGEKTATTNEDNVQVLCASLAGIAD